MPFPFESSFFDLRKSLAMPIMPSGPRPKSGKRPEVEAPTAPWTMPWTADGVALRSPEKFDGEVPRDDEERSKDGWNMDSMVSAKKMTLVLWSIARPRGFGVGSMSKGRTFIQLSHVFTWWYISPLFHERKGLDLCRMCWFYFAHRAGWNTRWVWGPVATLMCFEQRCAEAEKNWKTATFTKITDCDGLRMARNRVMLNVYDVAPARVEHRTSQRLQWPTGDAAVAGVKTWGCEGDERCRWAQRWCDRIEDMQGDRMNIMNDIYIYMIYIYTYIHDIYIYDMRYL